MSERQYQSGLYVDDLKVGAKRGMSAAAGMGFEAVQLDAARGETSPQQLGESGRRHLRRYASGLGLSIAALRVDPGGGSFLNTALLDHHVQQACRTLELARNLDVEVVSIPVGYVADDSPQFEMLHQALRHVAEHADKVNRVLAIEASADSPEVLQQLLRRVDSRHIKICFDPAELLIDGRDPLAPIETLADQLALCYARDGQLGSRQRQGRETNLGEGHLNLPAYLDHLRDAGYFRPLVVRRAHSVQPHMDLQACKQYLDSVLATRTS